MAAHGFEVIYPDGSLGGALLLAHDTPPDHASPPVDRPPSDRDAVNRAHRVPSVQGDPPGDRPPHGPHEDTVAAP
eukprot:3333325-Pyramimonas_sp.AAC.1